MDFKESKPIYMQIVDRICNEILTGTYDEGGRVPSVREYAAIVEVNANTVVRSFDFLQNANIIFNRRGIGYFVADGAKKQIMAMRREVFMNESLPEFFNEIDVLNISIDEVAELYRKRVKSSE